MSQRELTKAAVVDRLGVSAKQVERYVAQGMPCSGMGRARRFPWPECRNWRDDLIRRQVREDAARNEPDDFEKARARKTSAEASLAEIELAKARGEVVGLDAHEQRVSSLCEALAARCKSLGQYLGDVQLAKTDVEASLLLERISDDLLRSLMGAADDLEDEAAPQADVEAVA